MASTRRPPRIEFAGVTKRFAIKKAKPGQNPFITAVQDVSLSIRDGEVVSLIGPSGCGKSTLLNMGSGLDRPSEGEVFVDGELVSKPNPHVAFMLQKDMLLPWRTIAKNIALGLEIHGVGKRKSAPGVAALLAKFHLDGFASHYPHQLSGGMRQRAALARTLAVEPSVLLLDEPFSALDAQTKMILQADLARTLAAEGMTALFITHDLVESVILSDRVLVMSARPGRIVEELKVDLPDRDVPLVRRQHKRIGEFVPHLMSLLHVGEPEAALG
ncbi:MAG: ABC transporter ATP-binding protein [Alphaproteobacteria bacterium]